MTPETLFLLCLLALASGAVLWGGPPNPPAMPT